MTITFEFEEIHGSNNLMNFLSLLRNNMRTSLTYVPEATSKIRTRPLPRYCRQHQTLIIYTSEFHWSNHTDCRYFGRSFVQITLVVHFARKYFEGFSGNKTQQFRLVSKPCYNEPFVHFQNTQVANFTSEGPQQSWRISHFPDSHSRREQVHVMVMK